MNEIQYHLQNLDSNHLLNGQRQRRLERLCIRYLSARNVKVALPLRKSPRELLYKEQQQTFSTMNSTHLISCNFLFFGILRCPIPRAKSDFGCGFRNALGDVTYFHEAASPVQAQNRTWSRALGLGSGET